MWAISFECRYDGGVAVTTTVTVLCCTAASLLEELGSSVIGAEEKLMTTGEFTVTPRQLSELFHKKSILFLKQRSNFQGVFLVLCLLSHW